MKRTLTVMVAAAAMAMMQAASSVEGVAERQDRSESVIGEKLDSGLGTMVYGESLDSGVGELTAQDLQQYFPPHAIQSASLAR